MSGGLSLEEWILCYHNCKNKLEIIANILAFFSQNKVVIEKA
jgi:hypothetical protein